VWQKDILRMRFNPDQPRFPNLQEQSLPDLIAKYRPLRKESAKMDFERIVKIFEGEFWASAPDSLNDPFDCLPSLQISHRSDRRERYRTYVKFLQPHATDEEVDFYVKTVSLEESARNLLESARKNAAIISFSEGGNFNPLLWSHYASGHSGVCICVDALAFQYRTACTLYPVTYTSIRPGLFFPPDDPFRNGEISLEAAYLTKPDCWAYEKEWRAILKSSGPLSFPKHLVKVVILGAKLDAEYEDRIIGLCKKRSETIEVFKVIFREQIYHPKFMKVI